MRSTDHIADSSYHKFSARTSCPINIRINCTALHNEQLYHSWTFKPISEIFPRAIQQQNRHCHCSNPLNTPRPRKAPQISRAIASEPSLKDKVCARTVHMKPAKNSVCFFRHAHLTSSLTSITNKHSDSSNTLDLKSSTPNTHTPTQPLSSAHTKHTPTRPLPKE